MERSNVGCPRADARGGQCRGLLPGGLHRYSSFSGEPYGVRTLSRRRRTCANGEQIVRVWAREECDAWLRCAVAMLACFCVGVVYAAWMHIVRRVD